MRRRIWSEEAPWAKLASAEVLGMLRRFGVELLFAVRPGDERRAREVMSACDGEGVRAGVWPMLRDEDGRWANARNAASFAAFTEALLDALGGRLPVEVAIDLEPSFEPLRRLVVHGPRAARAVTADLAREAAGFDDGKARLAALARSVQARGLEVSAALVPLAVLGGAPVRTGGPPALLDGPPSPWERVLGTPVAGVAWDHASVMLYTSIIQGWSGGLAGRRDALALLGAVTRLARGRLGDRAGVSLGAVGVGAFGREPVYRSPADLAEDVGVARAAGASDLTLLDLGGALARPPVEVWLRTFVETPASAVPAPTLRSRAALATLGALGRGLDAVAGLAISAPRSR